MMVFMVYFRRHTVSGLLPSFGSYYEALSFTTITNYLLLVTNTNIPIHTKQPLSPSQQQQQQTHKNTQTKTKIATRTQMDSTNPPPKTRNGHRIRINVKLLSSMGNRSLQCKQKHSNAMCNVVWFGVCTEEEGAASKGDWCRRKS